MSETVVVISFAPLRSFTITGALYLRRSDMIVGESAHLYMWMGECDRDCGSSLGGGKRATEAYGSCY